MNDQDRLATIKRLRATEGFTLLHLFVDDIDWLIEEVDWLREENESLRAISGRSGIG